MIQDSERRWKDTVMMDLMDVMLARELGLVRHSLKAVIC
jgi:hypothetical protein